MTLPPQPKTLPFRYPKQCILVHTTQIDRSGRSRKNFGNLADLYENITRLGLIHPPTVSERDDGMYTLIGGGRRTAAMESGGNEWIPVLSYEKLPLHQIVEMEGDENNKRKDWDWQERVMWIARSHELRSLANTDDNKTWGMSQTGQLLGVSTASVSHAYQIRAFLVAGDPEISNAPTLKAAYELLLTRKEREALALTSSFSGNVGKVLTGFIGDVNVDDMVGDIFSSPAPNQTLTKDERADAGLLSLEDLMSADEPAVQKPVLDAKVFELSKMFHLGDSMVLLPQFTAGTIDHVVTDIPYGIDVENMETIKGLEDMKETHDADQNVSMMLPFLRESFRVLKPNGYCVFWYDLDHHEKLQNWAREVGFSVQRWPLVWHKLHPCRNNAATKNYTKNVEFAMVLRKGNASLLSAQSSCVVAGDGTAERKLYDNPFAKPAVVWRFIYQAIASKGQVVLDPFVGEMSSVRAAIDLGLTPMGIELDKNRYLAGLNAVKNKLADISGGSAIFK